MKSLFATLAILTLSSAALAAPKASCVFEGMRLTVERSMALSNPADKKLIEKASENEDVSTMAAFYLVSTKEKRHKSQDVAFSFNAGLTKKMVGQFKAMMKEGIKENPGDNDEFKLELKNLSLPQTEILAGQAGYLLLHKDKAGKLQAMSYGPMMMPIPMPCKIK